MILIGRETTEERNKTMTTAQQWREAGYTVIFRDHGAPSVYLYRKATGITLATPIDKGKWLELDNVNVPEWENLTETMSELLEMDLYITALNCYCAQLPDETCDFCKGTRRPSPLRNPVKCL